MRVETACRGVRAGSKGKLFLETCTFVLGDLSLILPAMSCEPRVGSLLETYANLQAFRLVNDGGASINWNITDPEKAVEHHLRFLCSGVSGFCVQGFWMFLASRLLASRVWGFWVEGLWLQDFWVSTCWMFQRSGV